MKIKHSVIIKQGTCESTYSLRHGLRLDALSFKQENIIEFDCRKANCGICIFKTLEGQQNLSKIEIKEQQYLEALKADPDERLACQCRVFGNVKLEIEDFSTGY